MLSWVKNTHQQKLSENRTGRSRLCGFRLCSFACSRHFGGEEEKEKKILRRGLGRGKISCLFFKYKLEIEYCLPVYSIA